VSVSEIQNAVLLVIDMQKGFVNEHSNHVVRNVDNLIRACQGCSIPIVFTRFLNFAGSPYEKLIGWDRVSCEPETDIIDELIPYAESVIDKNFYSAIIPDLVKRIRQNDWKTMILCGIATESCVLKTAADAFELGLRPIVVSDATASDVSIESHLAGLLVLESLIGKDQITKIDELLRALRTRP
jgi:nicotinamidase-related amidase